MPPHLRVVFVAAVLAATALPAAQANELSCFGEAATIAGTDGDDVLLLTPAHDVVVAGPGNDRIYDPDFEEDEPSASDPFPGPDLTGDDVVCAGPGDDLVERALRVDAGPGDDFVRDGHTVDLGAGDDRIDNFDCVPSRIWGGDGKDDIYAGHLGWEEGGTDGEDRLDGQEEDCPADDDMVDAGPGGDGDDHLDGWLGDDRCSGDAGRDQLLHCDP